MDDDVYIGPTCPLSRVPERDTRRYDAVVMLSGGPRSSATLAYHCHNEERVLALFFVLSEEQRLCEGPGARNMAMVCRCAWREVDLRGVIRDIRTEPTWEACKPIAVGIASAMPCFSWEDGTGYDVGSALAELREYGLDCVASQKKQGNVR